MASTWTKIATLTEATSTEVTGIAAGYREFRIVTHPMYTVNSAAGYYYIQFGDATTGGYVTSGSNCRCTNLDGNGNTATDTTALTNGRFPFQPANHGQAVQQEGIVDFISVDGLRWTGVGSMRGGSSNPQSAGYLVTLGDVDRIKVDNADASAWNAAATVTIYAR